MSNKLTNIERRAIAALDDNALALHIAKLEEADEQSELAVELLATLLNERTKRATARNAAALNKIADALDGQSLDAADDVTPYRESATHKLTIAAIYTPHGEPIVDVDALHELHCTSCKQNKRCDNAHSSRDFDGTLIDVECGADATHMLTLREEYVPVDCDPLTVLYVCESCRDEIVEDIATGSELGVELVDDVELDAMGV